MSKQVFMWVMKSANHLDPLLSLASLHCYLYTDIYYGCRMGVSRTPPLPTPLANGAPPQILFTAPKAALSCKRGESQSWSGDPNGCCPK